MTLNASRDLLYVCSAIIVLVRAYQLVRIDWSRPLAHGPNFFLAFDVPPGFYDGRGAGWLGRYRVTLAGEFALELAVLATLVAAGYWRWLPFWAGGSAVLYIGSLSMFGLAASRALSGGSDQPAVALAFETRRLRDYVSWPSELTMGAALAVSWLILFSRGDAGVSWDVPVIMTYVVAAMVGAKVLAVRSAAPLPVDRTEEHHRYFDAGRLQALRVIDSMRWFFAFILTGYAVLHGWPAAAATPWLRWALVAGSAAIWVALVVTIIGGALRLNAMGRGLRPPASWTGPFRQHPSVARGAGIWAVSFVAGLVVLYVMF